MKALLVIGLGLLAARAGVCAAGNWIPFAAGSSSEVMQQLSHAHWIASRTASGARIVYVFTDPECPYCNDLWQAIQRARGADAQIRYLLVAVIDSDSRAKDAAILEAADPAAALDRHERSYAKGGLAGKATPQTKTDATIKADEQLMSSLHIFATPGIVYADERGEVKVFAGMPNAEQLRTILGTH